MISVRRSRIALALLGVLTLSGCQNNSSGKDNFPPPQAEPAAAKAEAQAAMQQQQVQAAMTSANNAAASAAARTGASTPKPAGVENSGH